MYLYPEGVTPVLAFTCSSVNRRLVKPCSKLSSIEPAVSIQIESNPSLLTKMDSFSISQWMAQQALLSAFSWFFSVAIIQTHSNNRLWGRLLMGGCMGWCFFAGFLFYLTVFVMFLSVFETVGKRLAVIFFCCGFINDNNNYNNNTNNEIEWRN